MASYTFYCTECSHTEVLRNIPMDDRGLIRTCPECSASAFERSVEATLEASSRGVHLQEDINSYMERRFGNEPGFTPPKNHVSEGRGSAGAARHFPGHAGFVKRWV